MGADRNQPAAGRRTALAPDALGNTDAAGKISQPDNLKYSEKLRTLFIGEDSGQHVNNFMWGYSVDSGKLERLLSCPAGAESTGLHGVEDLNGWTYILSSFQHAGEYTDATVQAVRSAVDAEINKNYKNKVAATVGCHCHTFTDQAERQVSSSAPEKAAFMKRLFLCMQGHASAVSHSTTVSLAIARASHLVPWRPKLTWARASSPWPSTASTLPSPNLLWNTVMPALIPCEGSAFCLGTTGWQRPPFCCSSQSWNQTGLYP